MKQALLITLTALMLGGCATEEFSTGMTATSHYMASGHVGTAKRGYMRNAQYLRAGRGRNIYSAQLPANPSKPKK